MQDSFARERQWLIRKAVRGPDPDVVKHDQYKILGPYLTDQVRLMIQDRMLEAEDEISPQNGYWFALHELDEVKRFLGVEGLQEEPLIDGEATQPDLPVSEPETTTMISMPKPAAPVKPGTVVQAARRAAAAPAKVARPNAEELAKRFPKVSVAKSLGYFDKTSSPQLLGVEKSRWWSVLFYLLFALALAGVVWVIRSLRI